MDRMIKTVMGGRELLLNFSMAVLMETEEKYGSVTNALETAGGSGRDAADAVIFLAALMAADGELCRRMAGLEKRSMATTEFFWSVSPAEFILLKDAVIEAVSAGFLRETEDAETEIDLGLEELRAEKKKDAGSGRLSHISLLRYCT